MKVPFPINENAILSKRVPVRPSTGGPAPSSARAGPAADRRRPLCYSGYVADEAITSAYERFIEPVDLAAVIVTCASGTERAGCLVTFSSPCSIDPPRYAVWLSHRNRTYRVAREADELLVHLLTRADLPLAEYFGGVSGMREDKFARVPWTEHEGLPLLSTHGGWLRGRVLSRGPGREETGADHTCFVLEPLAAGPAATAAADGQDGQAAARPLRVSDLSHVTPGQPAGE